MTFSEVSQEYNWSDEGKSNRRLALSDKKLGGGVMLSVRLSGRKGSGGLPDPQKDAIELRYFPEASFSTFWARSSICFFNFEFCSFRSRF